MKQLHALLKEGLTAQQCFQITIGIARRLYFIHQINLMQRELDLEDIYLRIRTSVSLIIFNISAEGYVRKCGHYLARGRSYTVINRCYS